VTKFNTKAWAAALVALGALYMVASLALGRSARAEMPIDLSPRPSDAAIDVWKTATLLVNEPRTAVVDVRPADAFARYHLPGAVSRPGASAPEVVKLLASAPAAVVYAGKDEVAGQLVAEARRAEPSAKVYYLADGARAWYLALELPVPLFAEAAPPQGYAEALRTVQEWFARAGTVPREKALDSLQTLVRLNFQPTLLKAGPRAAASGGGQKKISGGCG